MCSLVFMERNRRPHIWLDSCSSLASSRRAVRVPDTASLVVAHPTCSPGNGSHFSQLPKLSRCICVREFFLLAHIVCVGNVSNAFLSCSMAAANASVWSADGVLLALMGSGFITVYDTNTEEQVSPPFVTPGKAWSMPLGCAQRGLRSA